MNNLVEPNPNKVEKQSMSFYKLWIKEVTGEEIKELRELNTGRVYVELMKRLLPACLDKEDMKKVSQKNSKKNMELLQKAFKTLKLKKVIPVKDLIKADTSFHKNYDFIAWLHSFFKANKLVSIKESTVVRKELSEALQTTIKTSKELIKECINTLNPAMHNVIVCRDFEDTYLSEEFETLKSVCVKYEKAVKDIVKKEDAKRDSDRTFTDEVKGFYKFAMEAGEIGSHIAVSYKHLEHHAKEDRMVKLANEVTRAGLKCIKLTRKAALEMQANFDGVDLKKYDKQLTKSLNDQKDCLQAAAAQAKLKFPESEISVSSTASSEMTAWKKVQEARIRAEVILKVYSDKV